MKKDGITKVEWLMRKSIGYALYRLISSICLSWCEKMKEICIYVAFVGHLSFYCVGEVIFAGKYLLGDPSFTLQLELFVILF